jgi:hypothetical protein
MQTITAPLAGRNASWTPARKRVRLLGAKRQRGMKNDFRQLAYCFGGGEIGSLQSEM